MIAHVSLSPIQFRYKENAYCSCKTLLFAHCSTFNDLDIFNNHGVALILRYCKSENALRFTCFLQEAATSADRMVASGLNGLRFRRGIVDGLTDLPVLRPWRIARAPMPQAFHAARLREAETAHHSPSRERGVVPGPDDRARIVLTYVMGTTVIS